MTLSITLSIMTLDIAAFSIATLGKMAPKTLYNDSLNDTRHNNEKCDIQHKNTHHLISLC
jgi:hypothetical protein